ncbi:MAG: hypothetical protein OIF50_14605 [Flavobacteriaceae bacterium]|nr:hypothetical protein [Flavobacteriaceae bacterium]
MKTYKQKNLGLFIAFLILAVFSWKFAIQNTLDERSAYKELQNLQKQFNNLPLQLAKLQAEENVYDSILKVTEQGHLNIQKQLLLHLNTYKEQYHYTIVDFQKPHYFEGENKQITRSFVCVIEGDFKSILQLARSLETHPEFGALVHLALERPVIGRRKNKLITATILLQLYS